MFLFFIVMMAAVHFHGMLAPREVAASPFMLVFMATLPRVTAGLLYWLVCRVTLRRLATPRGAMAMRWLDRLRRLFHLILLALFISDLHLGQLVAIRRLLGGDLILLDEVIVILPTLLLLMWRWWCDHAIDQRLHEAALMRRLDAGLPPVSMPTAGQYVLTQLRQQMALVLVPLLLLRGWGELADRLPDDVMLGPMSLRMAVMAGGVIVLLGMFPWLMRHLLDTRPLAAGPLRQSLQSLCQVHRVRVRNLLLWRTGGMMVNAAVVGLLPWLRYILLTDALLENVPQRQVEAVMAHEVGHVRRRHLLWRGVAALAILVVMDWLVVMALAWMARGPAWPGPWGEVQQLVTAGAWRDMLGATAVIVGWLLAFGWVSRRYERQADTFAVQHLARQDALAGSVAIDPAGRPVIPHAAAMGMVEALQRLVELNRIPPRRWSWMHGSIHWRQTYLQSLIGMPSDRLPIDRLMQWINFTAAGVLLVVASLEWVILPWLWPTTG